MEAAFIKNLTMVFFGFLSVCFCAYGCSSNIGAAWELSTDYPMMGPGKTRLASGHELQEARLPRHMGFFSRQATGRAPMMIFLNRVVASVDLCKSSVTEKARSAKTELRLVSAGLRHEFCEDIVKADIYKIMGTAHSYDMRPQASGTEPTTFEEFGQAVMGVNLAVTIAHFVIDGSFPTRASAWDADPLGLRSLVEYVGSLLYSEDFATDSSASTSLWRRQRGLRLAGAIAIFHDVAKIVGRSVQAMSILVADQLEQLATKMRVQIGVKHLLPFHIADEWFHKGPLLESFPATFHANLKWVKTIADDSLYREICDEPAAVVYEDTPQSRPDSRRSGSEELPPRNGKKGVCYLKMLKGQCKYGKKCRFSHDLPAEGTAEWKAAQPGFKMYKQQNKDKNKAWRARKRQRAAAVAAEDEGKENSEESENSTSSD